MPAKDKALISIHSIESKIYLIRGQKVMLDADLADLYQVTTGNLNKAITRNLDRFPSDFMFLLKQSEFKNLIFQSGTSSWGGRRKLPRAFTEQGVAMLSGVLRSDRAVKVNIEIMRAFVRLRHLLASNEELAREFEKLEKKCDLQFKIVFEAIRQLRITKQLPQAPVKEKSPIGFRPDKKTRQKK